MASIDVDTEALLSNPERWIIDTSGRPLLQRRAKAEAAFALVLARSTYGCAPDCFEREPGELVWRIM